MNDWEPHLQRWSKAGLIDESAAARIREWERRSGSAPRLRWPVIIALVFGAVMVCAGALLFVAAHWDGLSPGQRMTLIVSLVALLHIAGAFTATRFEGLSIALHAIGTITLGAGIAMAGQIFNLAEHWPGAIFLWALGAALAWVILRHWTQAILTALLIPAWLTCEWFSWMSDHQSNFHLPALVGICALSFTYLSAWHSPRHSAFRKGLAWLGGIALLPSAFLLGIDHYFISMPGWRNQVVPWTIAVGLPLAVAILLRGHAAVWNLAAIVWVLLLALISGAYARNVWVYPWAALGAVGLAAWGVREARPERINLGIAGFAITVLLFYFSDVMDKLGRSASLVLAGLLCLGGGWLLERTRRGLLGRIRPEVA